LLDQALSKAAVAREGAIATGSPTQQVILPNIV
jgi:hypothetical protein